METTISIPDTLFEEAERLAAELQTSRSQLYSRALQEFVARHSPERVTEAMNRVIDEVGGEAEAFTRRAAHRVLEREGADWGPREFLAGLRSRERIEPRESIADAIAADRCARLNSD